MKKKFNLVNYFLHFVYTNCTLVKDSLFKIEKLNMNNNMQLSETSKEIIKNLKENNFKKNISIINLIKNGLDFEYKKEGEAYFFRFRRRRDDEFRVYFSVKNIEELDKVKGYLKNSDTTFASIPKWIIPEISSNKTIVWQDSAYRFILPNSVTFQQQPEEQGSEFKISKIRDKDIPYINSLWPYSDEKSVDYIAARIKEGLSAGIYDGNKIIGWCLTHLDNSLAHLFVVEKYRRKNLAYKLVYYMSNSVRESGRTPYLFSVKDNISAHKLFHKLGYVNSEEVCWFEMKEKDII